MHAELAERRKKRKHDGQSVYSVCWPLRGEGVLQAEESGRILTCCAFDSDAVVDGNVPRARY